MLSLMIALVLAPLPQTRDVALDTIDGSTHRGVIAGFDAQKGITLRAQSGDRTLALGDLIALTPSRQDEPESFWTADSLVELVGGDRLLGRVRGGDDEFIRFQTPALGSIAISIDYLLGVSFGSGGTPPAELSMFDRSEEQDLLFQRSEGGVDSLEGTLESFGAEGLSFESELGAVDFGYDRLAAVLVIPLEADPEVASPRVSLDLADGSSLSGTLLSLDMSRVAIRPLFSDRLEVPLQVVDRIRFANDRFASLSDLDPVEVEEIPYIGDSSAFRFPWRRDRTVTGRPLKVQGRRFAKGLGVHSRCRLTFDVSGYSRFTTSFGVDDEVLELRHLGSMVFKIEVDGKVVFTSEAMRGGDPVGTSPPIDLNGVRQLTLEIDFGEEYDVADRGAWLDPVLLR